MKHIANWASRHQICGCDLHVAQLIPDAWFIFDESSKDLIWKDVRDKATSRSIEILSGGSSRFDVIAAVGEASPASYDVRDLAALLPNPDTSVYFDLTRLPLPAWAALTRDLVERPAASWALYEEPIDYRRHPSPDDDTIFQLTREVGGVSPLPGFVRLSGFASDRPRAFVAVLGFEGHRPRQIAAILDHPFRAVPIIACPGYRIEYPQRAVEANDMFLRDLDAYEEIRLVSADSPWDLLSQLKELNKTLPEHTIHIGLAGTRPHSLGAVLHAIESPKAVELLFDYPRPYEAARGPVRQFHAYRVSRG